MLYDAPSWQAAALLKRKSLRTTRPGADAAETYKTLRKKFPNDPAAEQAKPLLEAARKKAKDGPAAPETANASPTK